MSHNEYALRALSTLEKNAPRALLRLEKDGTDRHTDGETPYRYITLTARRGQRNETVIQLLHPQFIYHRSQSRPP